MRRTGRWLVTALLLWTSLAAPGPAAASGGGSWIPLRGSVLATGESFRTQAAEVLFESRRDAARAHAGIDVFYAYLVPDDRWLIDEEPSNGWVPPAVAIRAGTVEIERRPGNWARIRVRFEVPPVEPGEYSVMLCTEGCLEPLGAISPSSVTVTDDLVVARTARELDRLQRAVGSAVRRIGRRVKAVERDATSSTEAEADLIRTVVDLSSQMVALERRAEAAEERLKELEGAAPALAWLVVGAAGAALLILLPRRRRPRERPPTPPRVVEMELVEPPEMEPEPDPDRTPVPAA